MKGFLTARYLLWVLLKLTSLSTLWGCYPTRVIENTNQLRFTNIGHIPVIMGKINGKRAYFIIDTGASCSILNQSSAEHYGFKSFIEKDHHQVVGMGGVSQIEQAYNYTVEFGPIKISNGTFRAKHMGDFVSYLMEHENIKVDGIIGSDILKRYNITIDFSNNVLGIPERIKIVDRKMSPKTFQSQGPRVAAVELIH